jgi:LysM repeat protein
METRHRSPARIIAPVALVAFGLALLIILATAGGSGHSSSSSDQTKAEQRDLKLRRSRARRAATAKHSGALPQTVYVVKTGDTLASIAQKTGVPVEKLQELNPNLDPQALVSGQRLKLR